MQISNLKDAFFCVEASNFELDALHSEWALSIPMVWEQRSLFVEVGSINEKPVCLDIRRCQIWGKWVLFYHACSEMVNHSMIREWFESKVFNDQPATAPCYRYTDATNFHVCISVLEQETGKKRKDIWSDEFRARKLSAELTELINRMASKKESQ